jgi:hypothetical protein
MSTAHIAAHAAAEEMQIEEEQMTNYTRDELANDWEFKIVRSASDAFSKPEVFQQVVAEETLAGWQLLEKLDNGRIRFKRPVSARRKDEMLPEGVDPYRTTYGMSEIMMVFWVISAIMLVLGLIILTVFLIENGVFG